MLFVLVAVCLVLGGCKRSEPEAEERRATAEVVTDGSTPAQQTTAEPIAIDPMVVFEEPATDSPAEQEASGEAEVTEPVPAVVEKTRRPRVAIIIDDMGHHRQLGDQLLDLDLNLTFSFLPEAPHTAEQEARALARGREILLHLPMEPRSGEWSPGPDGLFVHDSPDRLRQKMERMFAAVPHATGANNHMGSRFTTDAAAMRVALTTLKEYSFYFIDSYTASASQGLLLAREVGIPTARRHVFLDNVHDAGTICRQIDALVTIAKKKGAAIAIGHPNSATLRALTECEARLRLEVDIVSAGQLVE